jgi:transcriptional regulator with XRE-family HTH domain
MTVVITDTTTVLRAMAKKVSYSAVMATKEIERGPTAERVSRNVAELRERRGLSLAELSARLVLLGRPILGTGLHKIEKGTRRVDVDDLVALAMALGVTPTRLLLPPTADPEGSPVELTTKRSVPWERAWAWASGQEALPAPGQPADAEVSAEDAYEFTEASRPYDPPPNLLMSEIEAMEASHASLVKEWIKAIKRGASPERLVLLLRAESFLNRLPTGGEISITHDTHRRDRG